MICCLRVGPYSDQGLENVAINLLPWAAFSSQRSQFFTIGTDPTPVNLKSLSTFTTQTSCTHYHDRGQRQENPYRAKNQSNCRIRYRAASKKKNNVKYQIVTSLHILISHLATLAFGDTPFSPLRFLERFFSSYIFSFLFSPHSIFTILKKSRKT